MATIDALNSAQQLSNLAPTSVTDKAKSLGGEAFGKALDLAMENKGMALPAPANMALDSAAVLFEEKGVLSAASDIYSMKSNMDDVFGELSTGIASSLFSALAGVDSATTVTPTATDALEAIAGEVIGENGLVTAQNIADAKAGVEGLTPFLPENDITPMVDSTLASLDALFDEEDEESNS